MFTAEKGQRKFSKIFFHPTEMYLFLIKISVEPILKQIWFFKEFTTFHQNRFVYKSGPIVSLFSFISDTVVCSVF